MEKQLCGYCGIVIGEEYFKCRICDKINCLECRDVVHKCCTKCAEGLELLQSKTPEKTTSHTKTVKRTPNPAFMRPMTLSTELASIVGCGPIPRTEVTKKLWEYIKKNGLQDPVNRRMINADDKLRAVFGGKRRVSMFEMTTLVSKHMK